MTFKELYFCNYRWDGKSILTADISFGQGRESPETFNNWYF